MHPTLKEEDANNTSWSCLTITSHDIQKELLSVKKKTILSFAEWLWLFHILQFLLLFGSFFAIVVLSSVCLCSSKFKEAIAYLGGMLLTILYSSLNSSQRGKQNCQKWSWKTTNALASGTESGVGNEMQQLGVFVPFIEVYNLLPKLSCIIWYKWVICPFDLNTEQSWQRKK